MDFRTNKIRKPEEKFGENAKLLEEKLNQLNWKVLLKFFFALFGLFLASLYLIIVTVRLALMTF